MFEAHAGDIVALHWLEEHRILISGARDCDVKFWLFPEDITRFKQEDALPVIVPLTAEDLDLQREIAELNLAGGAQSAAAAAREAADKAAAALQAGEGSKGEAKEAKEAAEEAEKAFAAAKKPGAGGCSHLFAL